MKETNAFDVAASSSHPLWGVSDWTIRYPGLCGPVPLFSGWQSDEMGSRIYGKLVEEREKVQAL
jgi:hypothetical protein